MAGRPSSAIQLSKIDPNALALDVVKKVTAHLVRVAFHLSPTFELREIAAGDTNLGLTIVDLCTYAQTGDTLDWGDASGAADAALTIVSVLYGSVLGETDLGDLSGDADPKTEIGAVLMAAKCRALLDGCPWPGSDKTVVIRELAALASLGMDTIYKLQERGELPATITKKVARTWLSGRGVPGFR